MRSGERQDNLTSKFKQLNPFELKTTLIELLNKIHSVRDIPNCLADIDLLDAQSDKTIITKLLFKELSNSTNEKISVICFLLEHFTPKKELISGYWDILKNKSLPTEAKITVLNMLRELDADWSYEDCSDFLDDADEIFDASTKQLLNNAIINPEVQIDFMDFMASIKTEDKITLINSLAQDFGDDELANILIPVFESNPNSAAGKEALRLLADTKSQLALSVLERMCKYTQGELNQLIRKSLATLKMAGIRQDNTKEFYAKILSNSKPDKFYITYPDGHGDMALICTRVTEENRIRFISIVINTETGIKDCFGFFEISKFECDKILEKFLQNEKVASLPKEAFKTILYNSEIITATTDKTDWELPYEYVCWKNLLIDIDYDDEKIENILKSNLKSVNITKSVFEDLEKMKISDHWFLDANYSDEFEDLIKQLKTVNDIDKLVESYQEKIFYEQEKKSWINKLIISAYIKFSIGKLEDGCEIYALTQNENLMEKYYTHILKRSIYEYLTLIKYNKDLNTEGFTKDEILSKLEYIEKNWVGA